MPAIEQNPTQVPETPTPPLPGITQHTPSGTAPMSTHPTPLSFEGKRAKILAARRLLNDALTNDYLIADLPDHLPACTCGSVMHAIGNYRELQFAEVQEVAPISGLKVFTMGSTPEEIMYIAHIQKWGLNRKFRNLDDLVEWFHPVFRADAAALQSARFLTEVMQSEDSKTIVH